MEIKKDESSERRQDKGGEKRGERQKGWSGIKVGFCSYRRPEMKLTDFFLAYRFSTKESATHAIVAVHNTDINGQTVKCSWGKESGDPNNAQQTGQVNIRVAFRTYIPWASDLNSWR